VVSPCYQSQKTIPERVCEVTLVDLLPDGWKIDIAGIEASIRPNTKMIVMNFPHNPTGAIISWDELDQLIALATKHDLWIFSDEVYRGLEVDPADQLIPICSSYRKGISLGVVSKSLGLAGLRIGWIAMQNAEVLEHIANTKNYLSICNSAPSEVLAMIAIRNRDTILKRNNEIVRRNLILVDEFMSKWSHVLDWIPNRGGCTGFVHYKGIGSLTLDEFADKCVNDFGVLILPGSKFPTAGLDIKSHFRFGIGRENFAESLQQFDHAIQQIIAKHA
jgi:aspartate/methionine/tyrosine aminotransferase